VVSDLWLVIPTGTRTQYLKDIFNECDIEPSKRVLVRTQPNLPDVENAINLQYEGEFNIQKWWNTGIDYARERGAEYVAVLNDDVQILSNPLRRIAEVMKATGAILGYPFPFIGHVCGYCWVLDLKSNVRLDENYVWWYGDRDLDMQARKNNGVVHVPAMVKHIHGNELTRDNQELVEQTKVDEKYFFEKWKS
jgi:glycosyltransferase involved in cell wall biosynthesis